MLRAAHAGIVDGNNGVSGMVGGGRREILDPPRVTAGAMGELDPSRVYVGDRSGGCRALRRRRAAQILLGDAEPVLGLTQNAEPPFRDLAERRLI
jgi:hypothetical protein